MKRRTFLTGALAVMPLPTRATLAAQGPYPVVAQGRPLDFPHDFGSHPAYRTEWWYITGWLQRADGQPLGVQITFFRHRPRIGEDSSSRFAPTQLLFAHAAIADPRVGRLHHDQRAARAGFGLAEAAEGITDVRLADWWLRRETNVYVTRIVAREFVLDLRVAAMQPPILQGQGGYSRKGPDPRQASYYYSEPQLAVSGKVTIGGRESSVTGTAWCDHEWSSEVLASDATGWDWAGINLADGGALMAFVMRHRSGGVLWAGGALRAADRSLRVFGNDEVQFLPQRSWRSPRTQVTYPVATVVRAGGQAFELQPLFDDQELDARGSTGTIYWEGAVRALTEGRDVGRGYLELTGYGEPIRLY